MKSEEWKRMERGLVAAIKEGTVALPYLLLKYYAKLSLTEVEAMILIHLFAFKDKENIDFPTIDELQLRMNAAPDVLIKGMQKLMKEEFIRIEEENDPITGIHSERYNLEPTIAKLVSCWMEEVRQQSGRPASLSRAEGDDIFSVFEKEFARPLTPMECETISGWLDQDRHPKELIMFALKEAIFAGKVHFRYIDRILLEWSRNRVQTVEQAKEFAQKFRGVR